MEVLLGIGIGVVSLKQVETIAEPGTCWRSLADSRMAHALCAWSAMPSGLYIYISPHQCSSYLTWTQWDCLVLYSWLWLPNFPATCSLWLPEQPFSIFSLKLFLASLMPAFSLFLAPLSATLSPALQGFKKLSEWHSPLCSYKVNGLGVFWLFLRQHHN